MKIEKLPSETVTLLCSAKVKVENNSLQMRRKKFPTDRNPECCRSHAKYSINGKYLCAKHAGDRALAAGLELQKEKAELASKLDRMFTLILNDPHWDGAVAVYRTRNSLRTLGEEILQCL